MTTTTVSSGQTVSGAQITSGDAETVRNGGRSVSAVVENGGMDVVGGESVDATISAGGRQVVRREAVGAYLSSGGVQMVSYGGIATETVIAAGARETVVAGGTASGTVVSGGRLAIGSAATVRNTKLRSGNEVVAAGGIIKGDTAFGTNATLSVEPATGSTLTFHGFKATDRLILRNLAFGAGLKHSFVENKAGTEGVLRIRDGALRLTVDLFGQYAAAGFHFADDGHGGTAITYSGTTSAHAEIAHGHT